MKSKLWVLLALCCVLCSCESEREKEAIKICQETKIQLSIENNDDDVLSGALNALVAKASFAMLGLDYETSTWLDMANMIAEKDPNEKFHWEAQKTDTKDVYIVAFIDEEDWGHFWEVNIKEKIVRFLNVEEGLSRNYGQSRLDPEAPFTVKDITVDTLKRSDNGMLYEIQGLIVNETGKSLSSAYLTGSLSVFFDNKTEKATDKGYKLLERKVSESKPWRNNEAIHFTIKTDEIKEIYLDYEPQNVFFTLEMEASDPIGYSYNKAVYEVDMKDRWNKVRREERGERTEDRGQRTDNHR